MSVSVRLGDVVGSGPLRSLVSCPSFLGELPLDTLEAVLFSGAIFGWSPQ